MDVPRANLPRVLYVQGLEALDESPLIALAQILLQTLNVFSGESFVYSVVDSVNARVLVLDRPLQLTVLRVSILPLLGCSTLFNRHFDLGVYLGVSYPSPPRQPALLRRCNPVSCLQYCCCKDSFHTINTAAVTWGYDPEVIYGHCRYLLAQIGVICWPSPVNKWWSL